MNPTSDWLKASLPELAIDLLRVTASEGLPFAIRVVIASEADRWGEAEAFRAGVCWDAIASVRRAPLPCVYAARGEA